MKNTTQKTGFRSFFKFTSILLFLTGLSFNAYCQKGYFDRYLGFEGEYVFGDTIICYDSLFMNSHLEEFDLAAESQMIERNSFTFNNQITTHYLNQEHKGLEVVGKGANVQEYKGLIAWIDADIAKNLVVDTVAIITPDSAISYAIASLSADTFSWENDSFEFYHKVITGDSNATSYPIPEKVIIEDDGIWVLAWEVKIIPMNGTEGITTTAVNATTGSVLYTFQHNSGCSNYGGQCQSAYNGTVAMSVCRKSKNKFRLCDVNRDIHTKKWNENRNGRAKGWSGLDDYDDDDADWNTKDQEATSAHWAAQLAHDYFNHHWMRPGPDGCGRVTTRIYADHSGTGAWARDGDARTGNGGSRAGSNASVFSMGFGEFNGKTQADIETVAHEYTHGQQFYTSKIGERNPDNESGALKEAFADIMGVIVEQGTEGGPLDWQFGENTEDGINGYRNFYDGSSASQDPQALVYQSIADGWASNGDKYINIGVINKWFQLLVDGTSNEPSGKYRGYTIQANSIYDVSWIAYYTMVYLNKGSEFADARGISIRLAEDERTFPQGGPNSPNFGKCKQLWRDVWNAWAAVDVGPPAPNCGVIVIDRDNELQCAFALPTGHTVFVPNDQIDILDLVLKPASSFVNTSGVITYNWDVPAELDYILEGDNIRIIDAEAGSERYTIKLTTTRNEIAIVSLYDIEFIDSEAPMYSCLNLVNCDPNQLFKVPSISYEEYSSQRPQAHIDYTNNKATNEYLDFSIVPNPSKGEFFFEIESNYGVNEVSIFDSFGRIIYSSEILGNLHKVKLEDLRSGIYSVTVSNQKGSKTRRLLITN